MLLHKQSNFLGLTQEVDQQKLAEGYCPLIVNGRLLRNTIKPIRRSRLIQHPKGTVQGIYAVGSWLIAVISGECFYADMSEVEITWRTITGWSGLGGSEVWFQAIPQGTSKFYSKLDAQSIAGDVLTFDPAISGSPQALLVCDGAGQPQLILPDGTARLVGAITEWSQTNPEYMPNGVALPCWSGAKLYVADKNLTRIYQSVSGRPLDFIIARDSTGGKGSSTADDTAKAVSYAKLTALAPISNGGILAMTTSETYTITPNFDFRIFGEPYLQSQFIMPVGAVNSRAIVDLLDDTAFIAKEGINSFNTVSQTGATSRNYPLGAQVADILVDSQGDDVCASVFDTYALFSVDTVYGRCVLVLDRRTKRFVSVDLELQNITQFAYVATSGVKRLFCVSKENKLYEAFADTRPAVCRVYVGDFTVDRLAGSARDDDTRLSLNSVSVDFTNIEGQGRVNLMPHADGELIDEYSATITESQEVSVPGPRLFPFGGRSNLSRTFQCSIGQKSRAAAVGCLVEWDGDLELSAVSFNGGVKGVGQLNHFKPSSKVSELLAFNADHGFEWESVKTIVETAIPVKPGMLYSINGTAWDGGKVYVDEIFRAERKTIYYNGLLTDVTRPWKTFKMVKDADPIAYIGGGDHLMGRVTSAHGDADTFKRFKQLLKIIHPIPYYLAPGNHDLDYQDGKYYNSLMLQPGVYKHDTQFMTFILWNDGLRTGDVEISGYDRPQMEAQVRLLLSESDRPFKAVVFHHPPVSDESTHAPVQQTDLPFAEWGANLVLMGHNHNYQRQTKDGILYVTAGTGGSDLYSVTKQHADVVAKEYGVLFLTATRYTLKGRFVTVDSDERDSFSISL